MFLLLTWQWRIYRKLTGVVYIYIFGFAEQGTIFCHRSISVSAWQLGYFQLHMFMYWGYTSQISTGGRHCPCNVMSSMPNPFWNAHFKSLHRQTAVFTRRLGIRNMRSGARLDNKHYIWIPVHYVLLYIKIATMHVQYMGTEGLAET